MTKRANGEGSIYKRTDGRWAASVSVELGRRKYLYGRTRHDVARKLTVALKARQDGLPIVGERQTIVQFMEGWLESVKASLRPRTWERYEEIIRLHVNPVLGHLRLARLAPDHLQRLYSGRLESGLSPGSVRQLHAVLRRALGQAAGLGHLGHGVLGPNPGLAKTSQHPAQVHVRNRFIPGSRV